MLKLSAQLCSSYVSSYAQVVFVQYGGDKLICLKGHDLLMSQTRVPTNHHALSISIYQGV